MAIQALNSLYVAVAQATTGGTAPGGVTAPTGCALTSPSDISGYVTAIDQSITSATTEVTTFGSGGYQAFVQALRSGSLSLTLLNDYAAGLINALIGVNGTVRAVGSTSPIAGSTRSRTNLSVVMRWFHLSAGGASLPRK